MMRLFNMYRHFVAIYVKSKMAYHCALLFEMAANIILIGVYFAGFMVIFRNFDGIAGWSRDEVLFMFTTSWLTYSLSCFFFWKPMREMGELVRTGKFDLYLTRPINPLLYLVLQQFEYTFLPRLGFAVFFWLRSMGRLNIIWSAGNLAFFALNMISAFVIFSAITIFTGTISFWAIKGDEIVTLLTDNNYGLKNYTDYPLGIYSKQMQTLLTFAVPYAFTGFYPVALLLGKDVPLPALRFAAPLVALLFGTASCAFWKYGLKHYGSAGA